MVGMLLAGDADMACASVTLGTEMAEAVNFLWPLAVETNAVVIRSRLP
jgi:hypothetical protein